MSSLRHSVASAPWLMAAILALGCVAPGVLVPEARGAIVNTEICDNCFDDDGNNKTDRDDNPVCQAPANGNGVGLSDESQAKRALKCEKAIEKAGLGFAAKKLAGLSKCIGLAFACTQLNNVQSCFDKAKDACDKQGLKIAAAQTKAKMAVVKACEDSDSGSISANAIIAATGLGFGAEQGLLECAATITNASDLADCVIDRHECGVERLLVAAAPRANEMLERIGQNVGTTFPCVAIADATNGTDGAGANLPEAAQAKAAVKCQGTLLKAGLKLGKLAGKAVQKCADGAAACIQLKPNDLSACQTKIGSKCQATFTKFNSQTGPLIKLATATAKKCTGPSLDLTQLNAPAGLGFVNVTDPDKRCSQFAPVSFDPTTALVGCVGSQFMCEGAQVLEREAPRLREYAGFVGVPIQAFGF